MNSKNKYFIGLVIMAIIGIVVYKKFLAKPCSCKKKNDLQNTDDNVQQ